MKRIMSLFLIFGILTSAVPAVMADGNTAVPVAPVTEEITDSVFKEKVVGNIFLYMESPKVRVGESIVKMDEANDDVKPKMVGNSLMLPADFLGKAFNISYTGDLNSASLKSDKREVRFEEGKSSFTVDGNDVVLSDAPTVFYDHLYIPLRAACEAFGKEVAWDKCGIIVAGDTAKSFSWDDKAGFAVLTKATRDIIYEDPSPEEVVALLKENNPNNAHPRLLLNQDKVEILRNRVLHEEPYKSWFESEKLWADRYLKYTDEQFNVNYVLEDGLRLLYVSRRVATYIERLAFTYLMTGDKEYAKCAIKIAMKVSGDDFPDWHPYHFLDTAEMAAAVALCYDWCYDELRPSQKWVIKNALVQKGLKPVMEDYNEVSGRSRTWYWSSKSSSAYPQNWVGVCFGGTTMAALAVGDEDLGDFTEVGNVITEGMKRMKDWLDCYMPDGACTDGTGYWEFAMSYMVLGISSMETSLGTDYSLSVSPGFGLTFEWLAQLMGSDGGYNFGSNNPSYTNSPEYFWWGNKTNNTALINYRLKQHLTAWNLSPNWKDVLWYEPIEETGDMELNTSYEARTVSMAVLRNG